MNLDEAQITALGDDALLGSHDPAKKPRRPESADRRTVLLTHHCCRALKLNAARRKSRHEAAADRYHECHFGMYPNVVHLAGGRPRRDVERKGFAGWRYRVDHPGGVGLSLLGQRR